MAGRATGCERLVWRRAERIGLSVSTGVDSCRVAHLAVAEPDIQFAASDAAGGGRLDSFVAACACVPPRCYICFMWGVKADEKTP